MRHLKGSTVVFLCAATTLRPAAAHEGAAAPPLQERRLEEIIVTAQRRSESLQRVPIAVSATSADMLEKIGAIDTHASRWNFTAGWAAWYPSRMKFWLRFSAWQSSRFQQTATRGSAGILKRLKAYNEKQTGENTVW